MRTLSTYWTPRSLGSDLFNDMDRFFDGSRENYNPAVEIYETEDNFLLTLDVPGLKREEIQIEVDGNVLAISGERKRTWSEKNEKIQRQEKSYGFFKRSFTLPSTVNLEKIEAHVDNGVLELVIPKVELAKPRQIQIQSGKAGFVDRFLGKKNVDVKTKEDASGRAS